MQQDGQHASVSLTYLHIIRQQETIHPYGATQTLVHRKAHSVYNIILASHLLRIGIYAYQRISGCLNSSLYAAAAAKLYWAITLLLARLLWFNIIYSGRGHKDEHHICIYMYILYIDRVGLVPYSLNDNIICIITSFLWCGLPSSLFHIFNERAYAACKILRWARSNHSDLLN